MPRPKLGPRINGPYYDSPTGQYKLRIFTSYLDKGSDHYYDSENKAERAKAVWQRKLTTSQGRLLSELLTEYLIEKENKGKAKPQICADQRRVLWQVFADYLDGDVANVTPKRAAGLYQNLVAELKPNGQPRSAATHQFYLELAKGFFRWATRKGHVNVDPFKDVEKVGRKSVGKKQLRVEEARLFADVALRWFDEKNDVLALATVVPLYLGLRASEVLRRKVRDVDAGGTLLWIDSGKTKHARRHLKVEAKELQERLASLASGRSPEEPLFGYGETGQPRHKQALWTATQRICKAAGVPLVCPHSFRGLWATLSVESGAASGAVAAALGHGSFSMTAKHYAQPEALSNARSARVMGMLRPEVGNGEASVAQLNAEQIIDRLSPDTLAKLMEILHPQAPSEREGTPSLLSP